MNLTKTYTVTVTEVENKEYNAALQEEELSKNNTPDDETDDLKKQSEEDRRLYDLTSISECLTVAMHEYDIERNKKQSFDNRAGIIITVFAAISISIYDKIPIAKIIEKMSEPLTFTIFLQISIGFLIYVSLVTSLFYAVKIIAVKSSENFYITVIDQKFIPSAKIQSVGKLLEIYLNLVHIHRGRNEETAKKLAYSQWSMIISIVLIMIYLTIQ
jgi:hypothetical protein